MGLVCGEVGPGQGHGSWLGMTWKALPPGNFPSIGKATYASWQLGPGFLMLLPRGKGWGEADNFHLVTVEVSSNFTASVFKWGSQDSEEEAVSFSKYERIFQVRMLILSSGVWVAWGAINMRVCECNLTPQRGRGLTDMKPTNLEFMWLFKQIWVYVCLCTVHEEGIYKEKLNCK